MTPHARRATTTGQNSRRRWYDSYGTKSRARMNETQEQWENEQLFIHATPPPNKKNPGVEIFSLQFSLHPATHAVSRASIHRERPLFFLFSFFHICHLEECVWCRLRWDRRRTRSTSGGERRAACSQFLN